MGLRQRRPRAAPASTCWSSRRPASSSLANTIAVAPRASNLMLLGDPQQLPQVSQGTHPEPVDASALGWLVDGHHTLPDQLGYFLDCSYRMHPAVCGPVSRLSYEGRLRSARAAPRLAHLDGQSPGVCVLTVPPRRQLDRAAPRRPPRSSPRPG